MAKGMAASLSGKTEKRLRHTMAASGIAAFEEASRALETRSNRSNRICGGASGIPVSTLAKALRSALPRPRRTAAAGPSDPPFGHLSVVTPHPGALSCFLARAGGVFDSPTKGRLAHVRKRADFYIHPHGRTPKLKPGNRRSRPVTTTRGYAWNCSHCCRRPS